MTDSELWRKGFELSSIVTSILIIAGAALVYFSKPSKRGTTRSRGRK